MRRTLFALAILLVGMTNPAAAALLNLQVDGAAFYEDESLTIPEGGMLLGGNVVFDDVLDTLAGDLATTTGDLLTGQPYPVGTSLGPVLLFAVDQAALDDFENSNIQPGEQFLLAEFLDLTGGVYTFFVFEVYCDSAATDCSNTIQRYALTTAEFVPEPASLTLLGVGLLGMGTVMRRRRGV